jgi:hypothetical protein
VAAAPVPARRPRGCRRPPDAPLGPDSAPARPARAAAVPARTDVPRTGTERIEDHIFRLTRSLRGTQ